MFGAVVAGRLLQTNLIQIDDHRFAFELEEPQLINHLLVFVLPTSPFPAGFGATVHIQIPPSEGYRLLGGLSNAKPSAIFRVKGTDGKAGPVTGSPGANNGTAGRPPAILGISIEPLDSVDAQVASLSGATTGTSGSTALQKPGPLSGLTSAQITSIAIFILKHLLAYLASFATVSPGNVNGGPAPTFVLPTNQAIPPSKEESYVQVKVLQNWYNSFVEKVKTRGPSFLENTD